MWKPFLPSWKQHWGMALPGRAAGGDNERLEFLGDAVLGLVVAESLFGLHPEWHEGELTRVRAQLVSRQHMAQVAEASGWAGICA
jgi:ribonuclease-3